MELIPFITIFVIYFLVAFTKPYFQEKLPFKICAICIAVSLSWLILLIMWLKGYNVSVTSLGILMGMSIAGIMYKMENFYKEKNIRNFWFIRLVVIIGGFYLVENILKEEWNFALFIFILCVILIAVTGFFFQGTTHNDVVLEQEKAGRKSSVIKKLDDCC